MDPPPPPESAAHLAAAYDGIAAEYDLLVAEDGWMRERLWAHHRRVFRAGDRVLDVGCGTGLDTLHLAAHGMRMTGIDVSPGMVEALRRKAAAQGLADRVEVRVEDAANLGEPGLGPAASFDGLISSFAALNTVDLPRFAAAAARLVRPGGRLVLHLLAPRPHRGPSRHQPAPIPGDESALRRRSPGGRGAMAPSPRELAVDIAGHTVRHLLLPAAELYRRHFAADFDLRRSYGLGWLWPRRLGGHLPAGVCRLGGRIDAALGRWPPLHAFARFFVLDLQRRERQGPARQSLEA